MNEVYKFLKDEVKLNSHDTIVVGVSAGPDSMALLYILNELRKKIDFKLIVAHVNHNVRKESYEEKEFLENYCKERFITFESMVITKYGDDNFHNEARSIRYRFYEELIHKYGANYLMTGHHGDDLVETILMRIVRGSTVHGYSGFSKMFKNKDYTVVRPLIFVTKEELENFDKENNIPYRIDNSNLKDKYTRNRYRKYVLPFLKKEERDVHKKFLKFSETLNEYDAFIAKIAKLEMERVYKDGIILIDAFNSCEEVIQKKIIDYLFGMIYQDDVNCIDDRHVSLIMQAVRSKKANLIYNLPNDFLLVKEYNKLYFKKNIDEILPYDIELMDEVFLPNGMKIKKMNECQDNGNDVLRLNSKDIVLPLRVRSRNNGDRMHVLNMNGTKKVNDILMDAKISLSKRDSWPIVVDSEDKVVWIPKIKKSKYNRRMNEEYDIIFKCY